MSDALVAACAYKHMPALITVKSPSVPLFTINIYIYDMKSINYLMTTCMFGPRIVIPAPKKHNMIFALIEQSRCLELIIYM